MLDELNTQAGPERPTRAERLEKPDLPYKKGCTLKIIRHDAPPPIGHEYCRPFDLYNPKRIVLDATQAPLPSRPSKITDVDKNYEGKLLSETDTLVVEEEIRVCNGRRSQLVVCRRGSNNATCVAKIYDPLYLLESPDYPGDDPHKKSDETEFDYTREVAAYRELGHLGGSVVPAYYGSWATHFSIQTSAGPATRTVTLILLERIPGETLLSIQRAKKPLTEAHRQEVLAGMIHSETLVYSSGVDQGDFAPRNVMVDLNQLLCDAGPAPGRPRVVLLDFNEAVVSRLSLERQGLNPAPPPEKAISPIERWWYDNPSVEEFGQHWFPDLLVQVEDVNYPSLRLDILKWRLWLLSTFGGSPRYEKPPREFTHDRAGVGAGEDMGVERFKFIDRQIEQERARARAMGLPEPYTKIAQNGDTV